MSKESQLIIKQTDDSPEINFDAGTGKLYITGSSFSEETFNIFQKIIDWTKLYLKNPKDKTEIIIKLKIFNTQTEKYLVNFLSLFENQNNTKTIVYWHCNSEEDIETVEQYKSLINLEFKLIKKQENEAG